MRFRLLQVVALRQLVGDLPAECLPGDECAVVHACGDAESCHDTPYGPKHCSGCAAGKAPDPSSGGGCTLDIDECCSNPCLHDGHCFDSSSGHLPVRKTNFLRRLNQSKNDLFTKTGSGQTSEKLKTKTRFSQPVPDDAYLCECRNGWSGQKTAFWVHFLFLSTINLPRQARDAN